MTGFLLPLLPLGNWYYSFVESNFAGKIIVILLLAGSVFAWSIMISKYVELRKAMQESDRFLEAFRQNQDPTALFLAKRRFPDSPVFKIYENACMAVGAELEWSGTHGLDAAGRYGGEPRGVLNNRQVEFIRNVTDRTMADQVLLLESYMGWLATAVSASPLLGLLGTVWGVLDAFSGMAIVGSSTLSAVAPGIAGALLTTVVGLLVALPSSIGYNVLTNRILELRVQMDNYAQEYMAEIQRAFLKA